MDSDHAVERECLLDTHEPPPSYPFPNENIVINFPEERPENNADYCKMTFGNILLLAYSISKMACCCVIYFKEDTLCSEPLDIWLIFVISNEALLIFYLLTCFLVNNWLHNKKREDFFENNESFAFRSDFFSLDDVSFFSSGFEGRDLINFLNNLDNYNFHLRLNHKAEKSFVFLTYFRHMNQFMYLMLFLWGCFLITMKNTNCPILCPKLNSFIVILLFLSLIYIFLPLFILICVCFCVPCLLISSLFCAPRTKESIEKDLLKKLEKKEFNKKEFQEHEECIICRANFIKNDKIVILPCSRKHYFHQVCVEKWLEINCLCPICRADLNKILKESKAPQNFYNDSKLNEILLALNDE